MSLSLVAVLVAMFVSTPPPELKRLAPILLALIAGSLALFQLSKYSCRKDPAYTWEGKVFRTINKPLHFLGFAVLVVLTPVYGILRFMGVPLLILMFIFNSLWIPLAVSIRSLAALAKSDQYGRWIYFLAALPLLLIAHLLVTISPLP